MGGASCQVKCGSGSLKLVQMQALQYPLLWLTMCSNQAGCQRGDNTPESLLLWWPSGGVLVSSNLGAKGKGAIRRLSSAAMADWAHPVPSVYARAAKSAPCP